MIKKKLIRYAASACMFAFLVACFVYGNQVLDSSAGPTVRVVLCVLGIIICIHFLIVAGKWVYIAFTDKADGKDKAKLVLLSVAAIAFILKFVFKDLDFADKLRWLFGLLT